MSDYDRGFSEAIEAAAVALENECADNPHLENFYLPTPLKYAADLVRSLKRPADQDGWIPIESAPRNGDRVLLWDGEWKIGRWFTAAEHALYEGDFGGGDMWIGDTGEQYIKPRYWKTLSAPTPEAK